jgi:3-methyladenine DNA glycosylase Mpg
MTQFTDHPAARGVTIGNSPRIGLGKAKDLLLRFFIAGNAATLTRRPRARPKARRVSASQLNDNPSDR